MILKFLEVLEMLLRLLEQHIGWKYTTQQPIHEKPSNCDETNVKLRYRKF